MLDDLTEAAFDRVFIGPKGIVRGPDEFEARREAGRARVIGEFDALCARARDSLCRFQEIRKCLERFIGGAGADIWEQLQYLIYPGFVSATPEEWFKHLPRYLKAISLKKAKAAKVAPTRAKDRPAPKAPRAPKASLSADISKDQALLDAFSAAITSAMQPA